MLQVLEEGTPCSVTLRLVLMRLTLLGELDKTDRVAHSLSVQLHTSCAHMGCGVSPPYKDIGQLTKGRRENARNTDQQTTLSQNTPHLVGCCVGQSQMLKSEVGIEYTCVARYMH